MTSPRLEHDPVAGASYVNLVPGGIPDGSVSRTVAVSDSVNVDLDDEGYVLGVEVLDGSDWRDALAVLAMKGRLKVT